MARLPHRMSELEIRNFWADLNTQQRRAVLSFADQDVVNAIRHSVRTVAKERTAANLFLRQLGSRQSDSMEWANPDQALNDLRQSSKVLQGFEFGLASKAGKEDTAAAWCMMVASASFVDGAGMFEQIKLALPDFLVARSRGQRRFPMPRSKWKELWKDAPTTVEAIDAQLAKLIEQALWVACEDLRPDPGQTGREDQPAVSSDPMARKQSSHKKRKKALKKVASREKTDPSTSSSFGKQVLNADDQFDDDTYADSRASHLDDDTYADSIFLSSCSTPRSPWHSPTTLSPSLWLAKHVTEMPSLELENDMFVMASPKNGFIHFDEVVEEEDDGTRHIRIQSCPPLSRSQPSDGQGSLRLYSQRRGL